MYRYVGEVAGWEDKRALDPGVKHVFESLVAVFQPGERTSTTKGSM